ncbi:MAG: hypothetical protein DI534_08365 [Leifsonia xyli]|nr:MAG: hypothetical protein DI534_08365 [Leifsonia xyli]
MSTRDPEPVDETDDDEALHWAGDDARGQAAPRLRGTADAVVADPAGAAFDETPAPPRTPRDVAFRVGTAVFALVYLAFSIGWIYAVQLLVYPGLDLPGEIRWQFGEFLAMVAAALWFAAALSLTPEGMRHRGLARMLGLLLGALLLVPWPAIGYWIGSTQ